MSIREEMYNLKTNRAIGAEAEEYARKVREEELGGALYDWLQGAKQGAEEVGRAATQVGATVPADYLDEQALEVPELDDSGQAAVDWYEKATNTFKNETVQPVAMGAALLHPIGMAAMVPFLINNTREDIEKVGVSQAAKNFAYNMTPGTGFYDALISDDPEYAEYRKQHPLRAMFSGLIQDADILAPAIHSAKYVRKKYLMDVEKKPAFEADKIVNAEYLVNEKPAVKEEPKKTNVKQDIRKEMKEPGKEKKRSFAEVEKRSPQEHLNIDRNESVSKKVDDIISKDVGEAKTQNAVIDDMTDVYGRETPVAPSNITTRVSINDVWAGANKLANARPNRLTTRDQGVRGYFETIGRGIRTRGVQAFRVLSHELGHKLDADLKIYGADDELINNAKRKWKGAYGDVNNPDYDYVYRGEGIAEFTREYTLNPEVARKNFPQYTDLFETAISLDPELKAQFDKYANTVRQWYNQTPEMRARGSIAVEGDIKKTPLEVANNALNRLEETLIDDTSAFKRIIDTFSKVTNTYIGFEDNPAEIANALKSYGRSRAQMLLGLSKLSTKAVIDALREVWDTPLEYVTLDDVFRPLENLAKSGKKLDVLKRYGVENWHEAFSSYMTALHSLEIIKVKNAARIEELKDNRTTVKKKLDEVSKLLTEIEQEYHNAGGDKSALFPLVLIQSIGTNREFSRFIKNLRKKKVQKNVTDMVAFDKIIDRFSKSLADYINLQREMNKIGDAIKKIEDGLDDYTTPTSRNDATVILDNAPVEFRQAAKEMTKYTANLLAIGVHYGFIDDGTAIEFMTKYPNYVPFNRDFTTEGYMGATGSANANKLANVDQFFKSLSEKGSDRTVKDPIVGLSQQTIRLINNGERNMVARAIIDIAKGDFGSELAIRASGDKSVTSQTFTAWVDGKKQTWQATAPGLYEALKLMNVEDARLSVNILDSIMKGAATTLRIGATQTPFFTLWNMARDILTASIQTKTGVNPASVLNALTGFFKKNDEQLKAMFEAQGVPYATIFGDTKEITSTLKNKTTPQKYKSIYRKTVDAVSPIFEKFLEVNEAVELAPRFAEFKKAMEQGYSPMEAGAMARDITTDFSRSGSWGRFANRYAAFFNAALQGNVKFFKNFRERPIKTACLGVTYVTIPTLALWQMNHDKDWYRDLPFEEKMRNWFMEVNGVIYRYPKPEMLGTFFGSIPERVLDYVYDNDRDAGVLNETRDYTTKQIIPNLSPTAVLPIIEWRINYSFFKNRPIVSAHDMKYTEPQDQYDVYTSEVAKGIGQLTGKSPKLIDNTLRSVTGSMGNTVLLMVDSVLKANQTPAKDPTDWTRFTRNKDNPNTRTASIFYNGLDRLAKKQNSGDKDAKRKYKGMLSAKKLIDAERTAIAKIRKDANKTGEQKRDEIKVRNAKINAIQRQANIKYLNIKYINAK